MCNITFPTTVLIKIPLAVAIYKVADAVIGEDIGIVDDTRDFLSDNSNDCFLKRRTNGTRRKCVTLLLKDIQQEYAERLKEGMFGCPAYLLLLATYQNTYFLSFSYKNVIEITMESTGMLQRNGSRRKCISK